MRALAQVTFMMALIGFVAALTLLTVITASNAMIAVRFTTFGTGEDLVAGDWDLCESFESANCG
jgi:hypothetical protein